MKPLLLSLLFGLINVMALSQSKDTIYILPCSTWGSIPEKLVTVQSSELRLNDGRGIQRSWTPGAPFADPNILFTYPVADREFFNEFVYVRWISADTSIIYDVKVSTDDYLLFETTSSDVCGLRLPAFLNEEKRPEEIHVEIHRTKEGIYEKHHVSERDHPGVDFSVEPLEAKAKQRLASKMPGPRLDGDELDVYFDLVDFFVYKKYYADAFTVLENCLERHPDQQVMIQRRYWELMEYLQRPPSGRIFLTRFLILNVGDFH